MQIRTEAMLRYHPALDVAPEPASDLAPSNFRILIVSDDMRSADSLKRTLRDLGYFSTFTAYSARRALVAAVDFR